MSGMEREEKGSRRWSRRLFIKGATAAGVCVAEAGPLAFAAHPKTSRIARAALDLDHIHKWNHSNGDTWDPFWADDGLLYALQLPLPGSKIGSWGTPGSAGSDGR